MSVAAVSGVGVAVTGPVRSPDSTGSTVALQAQLLRQRAQLADWESCVSAKTPEGKAHIATISRELADTQSQIRKIEAVGRPPATSLAASASRAATRGTLDVWA